MKILVVSSTPWNTNNSFGNSYSNIFHNMSDELEIANLYCSDGIDNDPIVKRAFHITPKRLLKNLIDRRINTGVEIPINPITKGKEKGPLIDGKIIHFAKTHRWRIFFWGRDMLWRIGRWNSDELKQFLHDFNPDLIFCPIYEKPYMNRIQLSIQRELDVPMLGYITDDNYTLHQFSLSPLYWIDRLMNRRLVKKAIDQCKILYVISNSQMKEYDSIFRKNCKILTKGFNFSSNRPENQTFQTPYTLFYAGNIGANRWKSLEVIGKAIKRINHNRNLFKLDIYTATPLTSTMERNLDIPGCVRIHGAVSYQKVVELQRKADILVHVEPTDLFHKWTPWLSFSTKIVDYFYSNRPILAYGLLEQASLSHLKQNDAAMIASTQVEVEEWLKNILNNNNILQYYADQGWRCGENFHDIHKFQIMLKKDFREVLGQ